MKFIKPSVEIITEPDLFKRIEIGARCCYKSESKISDDSAEKMVKALIKRGHESPLEHSNILVSFGTYEYDAFADILHQYTEDTGLPHYIRTSTSYPYMYFCGGNLRAWRSLVKHFPDHAIIRHIFYGHPAFEDIHLQPIDVKENLDCQIYRGDQISDPKLNIITARFICDRAVQNELVRHRLLGLSVESTRYVRYEDGLTLIEPWWWPEQETSDTQFIRASCQAAEDAYCSMIRSGCSPQKARCVLPLMLKTEVIATGTAKYWKECVLPLRLSKAAHPDIRRLMELFCEQLGWDPNDFRK